MGTDLRPSRYNFIFRHGDSDGWLLFNGLTSALLRLPRGIVPIARSILWSSRISPYALPPEVGPLLAMFQEGGFVVESSCDEASIIQNRLRRGREEGPLHLIVAPTLECNLACSYCYQFRVPGMMTEPVCNEIIEFVRNKLRGGDISALKVDWYGGEPLLAPEVISYLARHLVTLARMFGCEYESSIATNGTLLDDEAVELLLASGVTSCQVTVDGPQEIHDRRRGYKSEEGSCFHRILRNMKRVVGKIDLSVRVNIDAENISLADVLLDVFRDEGFFAYNTRGFFPYLAIVGPINPSRHLGCRTVDIADFYRHNLSFQRKVFRYSCRKRLRPLLDFPSPATAACGALRKNTYGFDPRGYFFKCALEIGEQGKECGHVSGGTDYAAQLKKWHDYDPLADPQCRDCQYLPFCMGNCPKTEFDRNPFYGRDGCIYWKTNLESIVGLYVDALAELGPDRSSAVEKLS